MKFKFDILKKDVMIYSVTVAFITGLILFLYNFRLDPYKNIERFYFRTSKVEYAIFKFTYAVIMLSCILSLRYIIVTLVAGTYL